MWENVWTMNVANEVRVLKFSPDGTLFATYGENDRLVKIWFPQGGFLHSRDSRPTNQSYRAWWIQLFVHLYSTSSSSLWY